MTLLTIGLSVPNSDVDAIEQMLFAQNPFVASFSHDLASVYSILTYHQQRLHYNTTSFLLPDRQIISYIRTLFTGGEVPETERRLVGAIMAFAIMAEIKIEPRMAMFEYADTNGVDAAWEDLCIFRHADNAGAELFTNLALGRISSIPAAARYRPSRRNLTKPTNFLQPRISTFDFCYPFILKIASLERSSASQLEKILAFEKWMMDEYLLGSSGALFGNLYLSPNRLKKMIKNLNSPQKSLRLRGVRNAAWDIAFIQEWKELVRRESETNQIWLGVSNDKAVLKTASRMLSTNDFSGMGSRKRLLNILREDWGDSMAKTIFKKYCELEGKADEPWRPINQPLPLSYWRRFLLNLEAEI